jgi:hypothetical protein
MSYTEPVRFSYTISIGFPTAVRRGEFEIDRAEWDAASPTERDAIANEMLEVEISNYMDASWTVENADLDDPQITA